jgi:predicted nucleotidyltransferase
VRRSTPQSHLRYPLTRLIGSGGNVRVLRALSGYAAPLSATQLAREAGLTPQGIRLVLDDLAGQGVVTAHGQGRSRVYAIDVAHPLVPALRALFAAEHARWERLLTRLRDLVGDEASVDAAWLYGSVARGEDDPASDVDLALVAQGAPGDVADAVRERLRPLEDELRVTFSVVALSRADVLARGEKDPWWTELVRDAKVLKGAAPDAVAAQLRQAQGVA